MGPCLTGANEKYCGDLLQKKYRTTDYLSHRKILNDGTEEQVLLRDHHEPIVSREQFEAVQSALSERASMVEDKGRFSARYWFSGKVRCGACGRSFTVKRTRRANGTDYQRFVCRGHFDTTVGCQMRAVHGPVILACAQRVLRELALDGEAIIGGLLQELEQLRQARQEDSGGTQRIQQAIQKQSDRRDRALEAFLDGSLSKNDMQRMLTRCDEEIERLRTQLEEVEKEKKRLSHNTERLAEIRVLLERELAGGDAVLDEVIQRITVYPDYFIVEVADLPIRFLVRAGGSGTGRGYKVSVTECRPVTE